MDELMISLIKKLIAATQHSAHTRTKSQLNSHSTVPAKPDSSRTFLRILYYFEFFIFVIIDFWLQAI